ncbi:MAG: HAD-IIB family hydrolase [Pseudomonadota bacterium]
MPAPLAALDAATCAGLTGIFTDLDDTLTAHGRVVPEAFLALERAREAGLRTVIITGRPAGWVDHLARMWPVDGVVGENGGLWFWHDGEKLQRRFLQPVAVRVANRRRLAELAEAIPLLVPGCAVSADQPYRELDLAIDFCEDVPALPEAAVDAIVEAFEAAGATCKVSSIHVNGWFGTFDKLEGCRRFLAERWGEPIEDARERWAYFGDSANDEPMFRYFPCGIGVANVARFLPRMSAHPRYITAAPGGRGFAEAVAHILARR